MAGLKRKPLWNQKQAVNLCVKLEEIAPLFGAHVALTGGCLYRIGERTDADILFYRIRQVERIDEAGLLGALKVLGFEIGPRLGWVQKAKFEGKNVDLFFPHYDGVEYVPGSNSDLLGDGY